VTIEDDKWNVYLVGLMGAGKTTVGKALARRLAYRFVDVDQEIEARTGVSVRTIFEIEGEEGFRRREAQVIADLAGVKGHVVATGGGAVLLPENRRNLQASGFVIYLNVPLATLYERTRHDRKRPLLQVSDPRQKLRELYAQRDPLYREIANLIISGSRITVQSVLQLLSKEMKEAWKR
jgi:shikimate kinase